MKFLHVFVTIITGQSFSHYNFKDVINTEIFINSNKHFLKIQRSSKFELFNLDSVQSFLTQPGKEINITHSFGESAEDKEHQKGIIHYNGNHLANCWMNPSGYGKSSNKWCFNRDGLAIKLNMPIAPDFDTIQAMLDWTMNEIIKIKLS